MIIPNVLFHIKAIRNILYLTKHINKLFGRCFQPMDTVFGLDRTNYNIYVILIYNIACHLIK